MKAADMMILSKFYDSSLHCSYYSVLQVATYLLYSYDYKDFNELTNTFAISNTKSRGSHQVIWEAIKHKAKGTTDRRTVIEINSNINTLKQMREDADYSVTIADEESAISAIRLAKELKKTLEDFYK